MRGGGGERRVGGECVCVWGWGGWVGVRVVGGGWVGAEIWARLRRVPEVPLWRVPDVIERTRQHPWRYQGLLVNKAGRYIYIFQSEYIYIYIEREREREIFRELGERCAGGSGGEQCVWVWGGGGGGGGGMRGRGTWVHGVSVWKESWRRWV